MIFVTNYLQAVSGKRDIGTMLTELCLNKLN